MYLHGNPAKMWLGPIASQCDALISEARSAWTAAA